MDKHKLLFALLLGAGMVAHVAGAASGASGSGVICVNPAASLLWKTVTASSLPVSLNWPEDATRAQALVNDAVVAETEAPTDRTLVVPFDLPETEKEERIVTLTVRYLDGEVECGRQSVRLGLVDGTQDGEAVAMRDPANPRRWSRSGANAPVVPIPRETSALLVRSVATELDLGAPGWQALRLVGADNALVLTAGDTMYEANLMTPPGLAVIVR